jgi:hypothetical protein
MRATELLQYQFVGVNQMFHMVADDLSPHELIARALPGTNLLAFDLWHAARTQDWALQTLVKGEPEIIDEPDWHGRLPTRGIGVGLSRAQADELAHDLALPDLLAYADNAHQAILAWLSDTSDEDLSRVPDVPKHLTRYSVYLEPAMREEAPWMYLKPPVWLCLGPALGHVRDHLSEMELIKRHMRMHRA